MALFFSDGPLGDSVRPQPNGSDGTKQEHSSRPAKRTNQLVSDDESDFPMSIESASEMRSSRHHLPAAASPGEGVQLPSTEVKRENRQLLSVYSSGKEHVRNSRDALVVVDLAGIAAHGIQICQDLLSYYEEWKSQRSDVSSACESIMDLRRTLMVLKAFVESEDLPDELRERVERCILPCEYALLKMSKKVQKLRRYDNSGGSHERALLEVKRMWYPFRSSTLVKLQEFVEEAREHLKRAIEVLQLDISTFSHKALIQVASDLRDTASRTLTIEAQNQRLLATHQTDRLRNIKSWLSPPDPGRDHALARQGHEPQTGTWLLQSTQYQSWKSGLIRNLWLHGKPGSGKTVLCSTAIEDIRSHCEDIPNAGHAMFYFSFSDTQKQSYENLIRSLVMQLGWRQPGLSMLQDAYDQFKHDSLSLDFLEEIMLSSVKSYDKIFLLLDALDECPESGYGRRDVLGCLARLSQTVPDLQVLVTSREVADVTESMEMLGAASVTTDVQAVDDDIRSYTSALLSRDRKLHRLDVATKTLIEETIWRRSDRM